MLSEPRQGRARDTGTATPGSRGTGITTSAVHQPSHEPLRAATGELADVVRTFLRENGGPGASVGVVVDGSLAWSHGFGSADLERGRVPDERTLYRIGSITKTFTASAIMALRDAGALDLDDPLVRHLPAFASARNRFGPIEAVTLRRLLRHTSGLQGEIPSADPRVYAMLGPAEVLEALGRAAVVIPPDSAYKYSNLGYHLLGAVVERVSGRRWDAYLRDEILEPLGMTDTLTDPREHEGRTAVGYARWTGMGPMRPARVLEPDRIGADGALWSSVADLARWISLQFRADRSIEPAGAQVLRGTTLAEMHRPMAVIAPDLSSAVGLGWRSVRHGEIVTIGHGGFVQGFTCRIDAVPAEGVGAIVLLNGVGAPGTAADLSWAILERVLRMLRGSRPRPGEGNSVPVPADRSSPWQELCGTYLDLEFGNAARVEATRGELFFVDLDAAERRPVVATADPLRFTFIEGRPAGEELRFLRGSGGRIDALNAAGYPMVRTEPAEADDR